MGVPADRTGLDADEVISYRDPGTAEDYQSWDDAVCWVLGYPFVPLALGLTAGADDGRRTVLDLGCGTGVFSRWLARRHGVRVIGADPSPPMLALARRHAADPLVSYHLSVEDRLPFLPDAAVDAATACFVFNAIAELDRLRALLAEVARVLRPGGRFTALGPHPDQVDGVRFESFRRGEPGVRYRAGQPIPVQVRRADGSWRRIVNVYWPTRTYRELFGGAGFHDLRVDGPVLADAAGVAEPALLASRGWALERRRPPFLLVTGVRAADPD
ncbi:class I SAM-dependent methyltransferase [Streptoalloteichus hindustanus]|uniref:Methyltransferase domain-containing protein n=1 Tax=Streptoalloteichus hindustanus TaxID=2017 RepID=A0A1M4ZAN5_STRHI|nr:class I SAM-dependent methyltransferase [Streptoalloteichus hindustanus]SHF14636.1 Methyltransferase domain-containing protein [Streptoalloteichus hindustanus]